MKTKLLFRIILSITVSLFSFGTYAQVTNKNVMQKISDERGKPLLIIFSESSAYKSSDSKKVFKEQLHLNSDSDFSKIKSEKDNLGLVHDKFQQYYKGILVEFSSYSVHSKNEKIESISGKFYDLKNVNTKPSLSNVQAFELAIKEIGATSFMWDSAEEAKLMDYKKPIGELVILPVFDQDDNGNTTEQFRLAYKFDIYATNPISRGDIYIDAITGENLFYNATIKHVDKFKSESTTTTISNTESQNSVINGNASTRYSGTQSIGTTLSGSNYILSDTSRGSGILTYNMNHGTNYSSAVNFTDNDNNWSAAEFNNTNKDNGALDAHWGAEMTYDYWKNIHGRNSFNNAGAAIKSYVHYSSNYDNAFWNGSVMTYGDGSGAGGFDILTSIDVAAHEIGHAVCSSTANLAYQKESGALNEALSDIWGACVEYYAAPNKQIWLIGEDIEMRSGHLALRSMSNPKSEGQPDTYGGSYWYNQNRCRPNSSNDYCGVHRNSGVLNHWFYILTIGKSGTNDIGNTYAVTGIGIDKAAAITYRMERIYLTSNSTYADARTYGIQAATDLYGANSPEAIATTNAFYAVGVGAKYLVTDTQAPSVTTNLIASNTTQNTTDLSWDASTDNVGVVGYDIFENGNKIGSSASTSFNVTGLTANTNYSFTVKAKDAAGNISLSSNSVLVTTLDNIPDTEAPSAPINIVANNTTQTTTDLSWDASSDNIGVVSYDVFESGNLIGTSNSTNFNVTGLIANTSYSFTVKANDAAGNTSLESTAINVTTLDVTAITYCNSQGGSSTNNNIQNVKFNTLNNTSNNSAGYEDFTSISTDVQTGSNYTVSITPYKKSSKAKFGYAVFIDFNGDSDFDDAGETAWTQNPTSNSTVSGTISIPSNAVNGSTRMRVSMKGNGIPTACEIISSGQVEDYTLNIFNSSAIFAKKGISENANNHAQIRLYPNPVETILNLELPLKFNNLTYEIFNSLGQKIKSNALNINVSIDVSELNSGMYVLKLHAEKYTKSLNFIKK